MKLVDNLSVKVNNLQLNEYINIFCNIYQDHL